MRRVGRGKAHAKALYVSADGRDSNACSEAKPCSSFQRAYVAAKPGEPVLIGAGTYGDQKLTPDPKKRSTKPVVFRPADRTAVKVNSVVIQASHVRFENFDFGPAVISGNATPAYGFGLQIAVDGGPTTHYACTTDVSIIGGSGHALSIQNGVSNVGSSAATGATTAGSRDRRATGRRAGRTPPSASTRRSIVLTRRRRPPRCGTSSFRV